MLSKKIILTLCIGSLACFSLPAFSSLLSRTYVFEPNTPKAVANPLFWHLDTLCTIQTKDNSNRLTGQMKKKTGALNGKPLKQGEIGDVIVKNKEILHITADVGAQIEITNKGNNTVIAVCKI